LFKTEMWSLVRMKLDKFTMLLFCIRKAMLYFQRYGCLWIFNNSEEALHARLYCSSIQKRMLPVVVVIVYDVPGYVGERRTWGGTSDVGWTGT
jgi:hypothetical protein